MQIWNWAGITGAIQALFRPRLLLPVVRAKDLSAIDWRRLRVEHGVEAVALDKDNCITLPYAMHVHPPVQSGLDACLAEFSPAKVAILSNSAGSSDDKGFEEAARLEKALGVPVLRHGAKKPNVEAALLAHFQLPPERIAMVGDRLFTDVLMGNRIGCCTVLTEPFSNIGDALVTTGVRKLEQAILPFIQRRFAGKQA